MYGSAIALATRASVVMPYARPLVVIMGTMVSDPAEMERAAAQWREKSPVGVTPLFAPSSSLFTTETREWHPPMAAPDNVADGDIAFIRQELGKLAKAVGSNQEWAGQSYNTFMENFNKFDQELALLDDRRKGMGDSLDSAASLFYVGAVVCLSLATILMGLATYVMSARSSAVAALPAEATAVEIVASLSKFATGLVSTLRKGVWKFTAILTAVAILVQQQTQKLPGVQAIQGETPSFTQALKYDSTTGGLTPPTPEMPKTEQPSLLPEFGW
ncbi:hypothetical protein ACFQVD_40045 [Streptosporangium amethystogenes subsp. fukuiense]|uniref:ESX-1 secretion-associated protein EspA/EspE-like domain-containing protein n=1 Tax=Streptosporangium amethystogenes subsp. fukuiense TaxID=698418 RepID=A0ABW2TDJ0_9ACTN